MTHDPNDCARVAGTRPAKLEAEAGRDYWWCACGRSSSQPLCDGSHKGTTFSPLLFSEEENKTVWLCTCKQTKNPPYCDGSHKHLPDMTVVGDLLPRPVVDA